LKPSTCVLFVITLLTSLAAQTFPTTTSLPAPIADGPIPGCQAGAALVLSVSVTGISGAAAITLNMTVSHTWYGDVRCVVTNPQGATAVAMVQGCAGSLDDSSDLVGAYTLADGASQTFDDAAFAASVSIPPGTYAPDQPLNALVNPCTSANGIWTVTFTDSFNSDTGTVSALSLTLATGGPSFVVCQSGPGAPTRFVHVAGAAAVTYTNATVVNNPGAIPNGWWFGLDIPFTGPGGLLEQMALPPFFIGSLGPAGTHTLIIPIPAGLNFQIVGVHFDAAGIPVYASAPIDFTVL
jgi:hypothetical protein